MDGDTAALGDDPQLAAAHDPARALDPSLWRFFPRTGTAVVSRSLRVVGDGEAPRRRPVTIMEAVTAGDYVAELQALHRRVALTVSDSATAPRDLAALTRRQLEISRELSAAKLRAAEAAGAAVEDGPFDPAAV